MVVIRSRHLAAAVGIGAVAVGVLVTISCGDNGTVGHLAGSGDSATGTQFTAPTVPGMNVSATAMSTGSTQTLSVSPATPATQKAVPTAVTSAATPCADNGVTLPGGCH